MNKAILILWPSFIIGGIGEVLFFTVFDPRELYLFGEPASLSRLAVYSIGFFLCWAFAAASSAFTCFLQKSAAEINRICPLEPSARPPGCPKREEPGTPGNG
ncbi:MAG: hypothetical protein A3G24_24360 [Betaproteobacteria bacterium RIFCSPLOWO2_12_FULL_62_13]|nr:MAG: hypothetical protein A3G24_24360 [Betaproteobacteria bacterium RIFCSPLOWO2_12_FULL_62_13]